ncbi:MAG TPA: FAD-binding oxidoreductase, partial [Burkholderiales bacterium]|nr:FAD-binding oxidoreductase [Burkholderiales bacterium]
SLGRMNKVIEVDAVGYSMTVEAGCILQTLQETAASHDRFFPLSLGAQGSCMIGGNLSTNAGGVNVLRYGNAREQVLGLEVVLPDGRVWDGLRGLRKDNTGYDLKQLFLGAEGTLGVITAAVLRLYPKPSATATAWIALGSEREAVELLAELRERVGERISAFELVSRTCLEAVLRHVPELRDPLRAPHPWYVLAQFADSGSAEELAARVGEALGVREAALAQSVEQARSLWRIRESIPEAQFANVKHDVSVPVSRIPEFTRVAGAALAARYPGIEIYCFGHVGDGNLHYNVGSKAHLGEREAVNRIVYDAVGRFGGSISAEHGLGQLKRDDIRSRKPELELELMRTLKAALDPKGLMNPGKVL